MDPRGRCWREVCFKEEEKEDDDDDGEIIPKTRNINSTFLRWQISLSLSQHDLLKPAAQRKSGRNCFTHPLVDPRYTTSKVVKGRWCAEAVPPRTKRDSQYIAQQRHQKTSGEHEWLLYKHSFDLVSRFTVSVPASQSQFFIFVISRLIDRQSSIHPYLASVPNGDGVIASSMRDLRSELYLLFLFLSFSLSLSLSGNIGSRIYLSPSKKSLSYSKIDRNEALFAIKLFCIKKEKKCFSLSSYASQASSPLPLRLHCRSQQPESVSCSSKNQSYSKLTPREPN